MEKYTVKAKNIGEETPKPYFKKEYEQLKEIIEALNEEHEMVEKDGMNVIIGLSDGEKILALGCVGEVLPLGMMLSVMLENMEAYLGVEDEEIDGNLN